MIPVTDIYRINYDTATWTPQNSTTNSTSTMFTSENLIYYLALKALTMHPYPLYEHLTLYG